MRGLILFSFILHCLYKTANTKFNLSSLNILSSDSEESGPMEQVSSLRYIGERDTSSGNINTSNKPERRKKDLGKDKESKNDESKNYESKNDEIEEAGGKESIYPMKPPTNLPQHKQPPLTEEPLTEEPAPANIRHHEKNSGIDFERLAALKALDLFEQQQTARMTEKEGDASSWKMFHLFFKKIATLLESLVNRGTFINEALERWNTTAATESKFNPILHFIIRLWINISPVILTVQIIKQLLFRRSKRIIQSTGTSEWKRVAGAFELILNQQRQLEHAMNTQISNIKSDRHSALPESSTEHTMHRTVTAHLRNIAEHLVNITTTYNRLSHSFSSFDKRLTVIVECYQRMRVALEIMRTSLISNVQHQSLEQLEAWLVAQEAHLGVPVLNDNTEYEANPTQDI